MITPVTEDYSLLFPVLLEDDTILVTVQEAVPTASLNPWLCSPASGVTVGATQEPDGLLGETINSQCFEQDGFMFACFREREIHGLEVGVAYYLQVQHGGGLDTAYAILPEAA